MKKYVFLALAAAFAIPAISFAAADTVDGFVCPVFNSSAVGEHNPNAVPIGGGDYTIIGPDVSIPVGATNQDGAGSPGGAHASPGDPGYSPIWGS